MRWHFVGERMAALPVLRLEDGSYLTESYAICRYLEELHPNPPLFGTTPKERAIVEMWNRRIELDVASYVTSFVKHQQPFFAEVLTEMDGELAVLEQRREKTRALKQAMMQELLTGRTRLVDSGKLIVDSGTGKRR